MDTLDEHKLENIDSPRLYIFKVVAILPYDEFGGEKYVTLKGIPAINAAEAVRYAVEKLNIPEIDPYEYMEGSREFYDADRYGIVRVGRDLEYENITKADLIKSWKDIFDRIYVKSEKPLKLNRREVIGFLKKKYKIGRNDIF